jgi:K(+)-stimulated pyrophosphate-energized sodium pump
MTDQLLYAIPVIALLGLLYTYFRTRWIRAQDPGNERMQQIAKYISDGAKSFLKAEYKVLGIFAVFAIAFLAFISYGDEKSSILITLAFSIGAVFSAAAGYSGMTVATLANVRTTSAARTSLSKALNVSFAGGTVMGITVVSLALLGLSVLYIMFTQLFVTTGAPAEMERVLNVVTGFSLGAESIALFARVGGGIYTKAADVGADLVGKVEAGIPEDDPRNPAVIADNVGDNVGDVAGMGADLFGSFVSTIIATMVLGTTVSVTAPGFTGYEAIVFPMVVAAMGTVFSLVGTFFVRIKETGSPQRALNLGNLVSVLLTAVATFFLVQSFFPEAFTISGKQFAPIHLFGAVAIGLAVGFAISLITEYYCSIGRRPVLSIIRQSSSGPATNLIAGLSVGMESTALPVIILALGIVGSYEMAGLYGVAMAASGMMATTGMQLAIDAFGPIADNAGGIAEMSALPKEVRERTDVLDTVGNTTAAIGKGFAIASAALTSLALFAAFMDIAHVDAIDISDARVLAGLFVGAMIPFLFSSFAIRAVGEAANQMVAEVRRQFKEIPGLLEGKAGVEPDYDRCIQISTKAALRQMIAPAMLAILVPILVGYAAGPKVLGGLLAGVTTAGVLMAIFQSNAGGAWDNAKKSFEKGVDINGKTFFKGSDPHKAAVVGDTVGDPFKDTSGPSMNILIKLMGIIAVVIAPYIAL